MCIALPGSDLRTQGWASGGLSCTQGQAGDFTSMGSWAGGTLSALPCHRLPILQNAMLPTGPHRHTDLCATHHTSEW